MTADWFSDAMPGFEKKITEFIEKHLSLFFFIVITLIAFYVRYVGRIFLSPDMDTFLLPWFEGMKEAGGFKALNEQMGDYNVLYQTIIAAMTYLPINPMTMYKSLSCAFDFLMAFVAAEYICRLKSAPRFGVLFNCVYTVIVMLPTVVINSALWGQCDSIYVFFILFALFLLYEDKYVPAFLLYGLAFALKLQAVFALPFFLACYFVKKKFSIGMFGLTIFSFWASGGIAYIFGRDLLAPFKVYLAQTETYKSMYLNSRSIWWVFGNEYGDLGTLAIMLALCGCGLCFYLILAKKKKMDTPVTFFNTVVFFFWVCIFFLPDMHERYAYGLDILLAVLAFLDKKYIKFAAFSAFLSFMSYAPFIVHANGVGREDAFIEFFVFIWYAVTIMKEDMKQEAAVL